MVWEENLDLTRSPWFIDFQEGSAKCPASLHYHHGNQQHQWWTNYKFWNNLEPPANCFFLCKPQWSNKRLWSSDQQWHWLSCISFAKCLIAMTARFGGYTQHWMLKITNITITLLSWWAVIRKVEWVISRLPRLSIITIIKLQWRLWLEIHST